VDLQDCRTFFTAHAHHTHACTAHRAAQFSWFTGTRTHCLQFLPVLPVTGSDLHALLRWTRCTACVRLPRVAGLPFVHVAFLHIHYRSSTVTHAFTFAHLRLHAFAGSTTLPLLPCGCSVGYARLRYSLSIIYHLLLPLRLPVPDTFHATVRRCTAHTRCRCYLRVRVCTFAIYTHFVRFHTTFAFYLTPVLYPVLVYTHDCAFAFYTTWFITVQNSSILHYTLLVCTHFTIPLFGSGFSSLCGYTFFSSDLYVWLFGLRYAVYIATHYTHTHTLHTHSAVVVTFMVTFTTHLVCCLSCTAHTRGYHTTSIRDTLHMHAVLPWFVPIEHLRLVYRTHIPHTFTARLGYAFVVLVVYIFCSVGYVVRCVCGRLRMPVGSLPFAFWFGCTTYRLHCVAYLRSPPHHICRIRSRFSLPFARFYLRLFCTWFSYSSTRALNINDTTTAAAPRPFAVHAHVLPTCRYTRLHRHLPPPARCAARFCVYALLLPAYHQFFTRSRTVALPAHVRGCCVAVTCLLDYTLGWFGYVYRSLLLPYQFHLCGLPFFYTTHTYFWFFTPHLPHLLHLFRLRRFTTFYHHAGCLRRTRLERTIYRFGCTFVLRIYVLYGSPHGAVGLHCATLPFYTTVPPATRLPAGSAGYSLPRTLPLHLTLPHTVLVTATPLPHFAAHAAPLTTPHPVLSIAVTRVRLRFAHHVLLRAPRSRCSTVQFLPPGIHGCGTRTLPHAVPFTFHFRGSYRCSRTLRVAGLRIRIPPHTVGFCVLVVQLRSVRFYLPPTTCLVLYVRLLNTWFTRDYAYAHTRFRWFRLHARSTFSRLRYAHLPRSYAPLPLPAVTCGYTTHAHIYAPLDFTLHTRTHAAHTGCSHRRVPLLPGLHVAGTHTALQVTFTHTYISSGLDSCVVYTSPLPFVTTVVPWVTHFAYTHTLHICCSSSFIRLALRLPIYALRFARGRDTPAWFSYRSLGSTPVYSPLQLVLPSRWIPFSAFSSVRSCLWLVLSRLDFRG